MKYNYLDAARRLNDHELLAHVTSLAGRERAATSGLVAHLAEIDARRLYLGAGFASMFAYCRDALSLSESEAYSRIEAARVARRCPMVLDLLVEGAINLTTVRLLAPHLTADNGVEVLQSARGLKKPQVEELVARLAPRPDVPASVRKLPDPKPVAVVPAAEPAPSPTAPGGPLPTDSQARHEFRSVAAAPPPPEARRAAVSALSPDRYKLQLTISGDTLERLRLAKDLLRQALPTGDDAALLDCALQALLADVLKQKFAATDRPRGRRGTPNGSRYIPAEVKRAVYLRDFGRCAFVGTSGRRCGERSFLEFHHLQPYAEDGPATVDNIELRCRRHNAHEWQQWCRDRSRVEDHAPGGRCRVVGAMSGAAMSAAPPATRT